MADSGKNAITTYSGDAATLVFALSWTTSPDSSQGLPYLTAAHVQVVVTSVTKTLGTHYNMSADGLSVEFVAGQAPPSAANNVVLTRVTPHSALYVIPVDGEPITAGDFIDALCQSIFYTEEVEDQ